MTVKELIQILEEVENKEKEVFVYNELDETIHKIAYVDLAISDRVDLNINL